MRKSLLTTFPLLAMMALMVSSCADECCEHPSPNEPTICRKDLPPGNTVGWPAYKLTIQSAGYVCD